MTMVATYRHHTACTVPAPIHHTTHLLHVLQCFDLAGRLNWHVQHSLSGHSSSMPVFGYNAAWRCALAGVTVPGSENEAAMWTTRQATTTAMPKYLHTAGIDELMELNKQRLESGHRMH